MSAPAASSAAAVRAIWDAVDGPMTSTSPSPSARRSWTGPNRVENGSVASSAAGKVADAKVDCADATSCPG